MNSTHVLNVLLLCGLMGLVGQGIRAILGLKKSAELEKTNPTVNSSFNAAYLIVSLMIGFIAGILAGIGIGLDQVDLATTSNLKVLLGIAAAGYAGTDFIESALSTIMPGLNNPPQATPQPQKPASVANDASGANQMMLATHLVGSGQSHPDSGTQSSAPSAGAQTPVATAMPIYGFDCDHYPGDAAVNWLRQHGRFRVSVCYLAHEPGTKDDSWISKYGYLKSNGWGLLPTYAGLQIHSPQATSKTGVRDGKEAVALMKEAGFLPASIVYLDMEDGTIPAKGSGYLDYVSSWISTVKVEGFTPGLYCSYLLIGWARGYTSIIWSFRIPLHTSGDVYDPDDLPEGKIEPYCIATQYRQGVGLTGLTIPHLVDSQGLDLNLCAVADPSDLASVSHALQL
jgi:hypothetical protein